MNYNRLLYLTQNHAGFPPTADEWEEVKKLAAEAVKENTELGHRAVAAEAAHESANYLLVKAEEDRDKYLGIINGNVRDVLLNEMHFQNGAMEMYLEHPIFGLFALGIAEMFIGMKATNYLETRIFCDKVGFVVVTCQKEDGKTPHQLRKEAESDRDSWRKIAQEYEARLAEEDML